MEKEYYRAYYALERNHWWFKGRQKILETQIIKIFPNRTDLKILNAGCATGFSSEWLMQFGEVVSLEYDPECYAFTRDVVKISIVQGSILELPFKDKQFDLVVAFDVIEHVDNDVLAVQEMCRVCKMSGYVFVSVPAYLFLWSQHDEINHHFRRYTKNTLRKVFNKSDLTPIFESYFNTFLFLPIAFVRVMLNFFRKFKKQDASKINENAPSDLEIGSNKILSTILYRIFAGENFLLKRRLRLPFGVSIMAMYKNKTIAKHA